MSGLACQLVYTTDRTLLGAPVLVGTFLQSAVDVVDVVHGDRFDYGLSLLGEASQELTLSATVSYQSDGGTSASGNTRTSVTFSVPYDAPSALHLVDCFPE